MYQRQRRVGALRLSPLAYSILLTTTAVPVWCGTLQAQEFVTGISYFAETSDSPRAPLINAIGSSTWAGQAANGNLCGCFANNGFCATEAPRLRVTGDSFTEQDSTAVAVFASSTTLNMNVTDDVMIYLTGSKAFRAGSFNTSTLAPTATRPYHLVTIAPVPPEELLNKELGFRTEWIDRRLRFNTTYYDMDFTNRQGASAVADANSPVGFTIQLVNQGDAKLSGIEVEAEFAVTNQFSLDASAGWADYEMENPCINNGLYLFPPPVDRSYTLGGRYEIPMQDGGLTLSANFAHTGPQETHPGGLTAEQAAAFGCAAGPGGPPVATWFRDSRYRVAEFDTLNAVMRGAQADYRARPREVGFSFEYNFF